MIEKKPQRGGGLRVSINAYHHKKPRYPKRSEVSRGIESIATRYRINWTIGLRYSDTFLFLGFLQRLKDIFEPLKRVIPVQ